MWHYIHLADSFPADVYRIPLSSPAAMAKEIKSRARSLESILEGVEIKHPLVRATHTARCSVISSLVYSPRLKFKPLCRLWRLSKRSRSSKRKQGRRTQQRRIRSYKRNRPLPTLSSPHCSAGLWCPLCNPRPRLLLLTCPGPPPSHPQRTLPLPHRHCL